MLSFPIFQRGAAGIPTTTPMLAYRNLAPRVEGLEFTICAVGGFESLRASFTGTRKEAIFWLREGLMCSTVLADAHAFRCWEGVISGVEVQIGGVSASVSLDAMANSVRVRYTTINGVAGASPSTTTFTSDAASIALYGTKQAVVSSGTDNATDAAFVVSRYLAQNAFPRAGGASEDGRGNDAATISLTGLGWYFLLDHLVTGSTTTSTAVSTAQITGLVTAYNVTNDFLSESYINVEASGRSPSQSFPQDTTYRSRIETLLGFGNASSERMVGGIYEDRKLYVNTWAGADPATVHYWQSLTSGKIKDASGGTVFPWRARPDRMMVKSAMVDPSPTVGPDSGARSYVERTRCTVDRTGARVALEPEASNDLTALMTRLDAGVR